MQELNEKIQQQADEKLRRSEERYNKLVDSLKNHYFFYALTTDGYFNYISDSVENILGYKPKDMLNKHFKEFLVDNDMNKALDTLKIDTNKPIIINVKHNKNTEDKYIEILSFPVYDKENNIIEMEGIARDITQEYLAREKLHFISEHDTLTGLLNRRSLYNRLNLEIAEQNNFTILYMDLDYFKEVNDTMGHDIGDKLLKDVTNRVKKLRRRDDIFARVGGDEFVIVLQNLSKDITINIAKKIIYALEETFTIDKNEIHISTSIGVSRYPQDDNNIKELLKKADSAMYYTKKHGKNNFTYFDEIPH
jgi:diguanylate cyclase (GGDEF)-like protein/PAS domain S-box-containing protein